ncbi:hypothetical protein H8J86_08485 [Clostridium perfringens]|uniref:hypothetical protein n=1 Tax=Clostridium perfringens TaxID=1502 RepID=UPI0018E446B4|nr:hypothetical protein [Clostridium perfringens]MBI6005991.1 hypothetical protein [Clostridium perfringens]
MAIYFTQNTNSAEDIEQMNKVIDKMNQASANATSNINQLTDLNAKAEELSNNVNQALPINTDLKKNIEIGKPLVQEAASKNTELQASLEKTKEFIEGLDGSQNIPQLRLDVTELQNGLKSNQTLAYTGSSISADNTLEGRTEGMRIGGRTLVNLLIPKKANLQGGWVLQDDNIFSVESDGNGFADIRFNDLPIKPNTNYTCYIEILENTLVGEGGISVFGFSEFGNGTSIPYNSKGVIKVKSLSTDKNGFYFGFYKNSITSGCLKLRLMLIEGNNNNTINYFEGLKSFGETEQEGDKYKISISSTGKNLYTNEVVNSVSGTFEILDNGFIAESTFYTAVKIPKLDKSKSYYFQFDKQIISGDFERVYYAIIYDETEKKTVTRVNLTGSDRVVLNELYNPNNENKLYFYTGSGIASKCKFYNIQLFEGDSHSSIYEPYKQDKKDILIKESLRSKGDICDLLYEDNGQVKIDRHVGIRKYQDGDENNKNVITDKINTVYVLDKPVTEIVENCVDIDLDTFGEKTYFSILNSIKGSLDFKVPSNIASIVQNTAREVNNIWDVINNLLVPSLIDINKNVAMATIKNNLK